MIKTFERVQKRRKAKKKSRDKEWEESTTKLSVLIRTPKIITFVTVDSVARF